MSAARGRERFDVVVVGGRIAGAAAAWALAPYVRDVLVLERAAPGAFWPQAASWDRSCTLLWQELGLLDTVLGCGAPKLTGHVFRTLGTEVEYRYPREDEHCYRMSVAREVLDPALLSAALGRGNVELRRPATVTGLLYEGGRVAGVEYRDGRTARQALCDLVVLADGRVSRNADRLGAAPYATVPSPWTSLLHYCGPLELDAGRGYYSRQPGAMVVVVPCGPDSWCVSASLHRELIERSGAAAVRTFAEVVRRDPLVGPAVSAAEPLSRVGGAGKLRLLRRPMAGPGWCLVGDSGYFLDPLTALGTRGALTAVTLLRDRVAAAGGAAVPGLHTGLTARRDALLDAGWQRTVRAVGGPDVPAEQLARARALAADPAAALAAVRAQMDLAPVAGQAAGTPRKGL
ncbi:NAD(P)/FAD-dependent oxidoreductase [Streptomyces sp. NPDC021224]|uniref:NAD(P)/FAD-dependent oxidoreductase n=1 Tax=unclassified Streptomyces TaxID=2593676 RepID=UPI0037A74B1F